MYKIAKITFRPFEEERQSQIDTIDVFLNMLFMNGQILDNTVLEDHGTHFVARVVTTDSDALNPKYFNEYIRDELSKFDMTTEIVCDDPLAEDHCNCKSHSFLVIFACMEEQSSPVICGDCGREIPLFHLPYLFGEKEHYSFLSWQRMYQCTETLWRESLSDRFTKRQMIDPRSQLNQRGLEIRQELEYKTQTPVYLFLRNPIDGLYNFEKNNKDLSDCPNCGGNFRLLENAPVDKVCDTCKLAFFNMQK